VNPSNPVFFGDPAVRLHAVVSAVGQHMESSICSDDYSAGLESFGSMIASRARGLSCLPFDLPAKAGGAGPLIDCTVQQTAADGTKTDIPQCSTPPVPPCFQIAPDSRCGGTTQNLLLTVAQPTSPIIATEALTCVTGYVMPPPSNNNGGNGGNGVFSCDIQNAATHSCTDYSFSGASDPTSAWKQGCSQAGGTAGSGCSHSGAVGGCKVTASSSGVSVTTTTWYYFGDAATVMSACSAAKGTFVGP
jgi:hypothetical protein